MRKKNILQGEKARNGLNYSSPGYKPGFSSKGFTMIEILIAMVIFSVGILGVAKMQIAGINGNATARVVTDTVVQATDQIELLMLLPYDHLDLTAGHHDDSTAVMNKDSAYPGYTLVWEVSDDIPVEGNKTITITVTPTGIKSDNIFTIQQIKSEVN